MLTESEYARHVENRPAPDPHPLCALIRELRAATRLSLAQFEERFGISAVVVGAYERGDRIPPVPKLEAILNCFGYRLAAVPAGTDAVRLPGDMVADLRAIADQLAAMHATGTPVAV